jgi:hypothetical protein
LSITICWPICFTSSAGQNPRHDVGRAARGGRNDEADRAFRIGGGGAAACASAQAIAASSSHDIERMQFPPVHVRNTSAFAFDCVALRIPGQTMTQAPIQGASRAIFQPSSRRV